MMIQQSRGLPCDVRPERMGGVHVSDLLRADAMKRAAERAAEAPRKWWQIWN